MRGKPDRLFSVSRREGLAKPRAARSPLENIRWQDCGKSGQIHEADRLQLAHAGTDAKEQIADGLRGVAGGEFEAGELIHIDCWRADRRPGCMKRSAALTSSRRSPTSRAQDLDDESGQLQRVPRDPGDSRRSKLFQPTMPSCCPEAHASLAQDIRE